MYCQNVALLTISHQFMCWYKIWKWLELQCIFKALWQAVWGRGPWEWGEAGGASVNEHHLYATLVSSFSWRSFGKIKGGATTLKDERRPGLYFILSFVYVCLAVIREGLPLFLLFCACLFYDCDICVKHSLVLASFFPESMSLLQVEYVIF